MPDKKGSDDRAYARGFAAGRAAATPPDTDLLAELVKLVEIHHNTVRPSKLHDPVSIHDWRDCPCLTCRRVASVEAVVKAEGRTPAVSPDERLREALALIAQHARLDLTERGIAEAERYAVIAEDALAATDRRGTSDE